MPIPSSLLKQLSPCLPYPCKAMVGTVAHLNYQVIGVPRESLPSPCSSNPVFHNNQANFPAGVLLSLFGWWSTSRKSPKYSGSSHSSRFNGTLTGYPSPCGSFLLSLEQNLLFRTVPKWVAGAMVKEATVLPLAVSQTHVLYSGDTAAYNGR